MAVTDSLLRASAGWGGSAAVLIAVLAPVLAVILAIAPAAALAIALRITPSVGLCRLLGTVRRNRRAAGKAAGAGRGRRRLRIRIRRAHRASAVRSGNAASLRWRHRRAVHQLLLAIDHDLLTRLEIGAVREHRVGADGEVDVNGNRVGVELLARLAIAATPTPTPFSRALPVAGGCGCGRFGVAAARGGRGLSGQVLDLVRRRWARVHDEDVIALVAVLNRGSGHNDRIRPLAQDEPNIHKLVREQRVVGVVKDSL